MQRLEQRKSSYSTRRFLGCEIAKAVGDIITCTYHKSLAERICTLSSSNSVSFQGNEIQQLIKRNIGFMSANSIEGTVSVSQAAFFVSNIRDRVISTISVKKCDNH